MKFMLHGVKLVELVRIQVMSCNSVRGLEHMFRLCENFSFLQRVREYLSMGVLLKE